MSFYQFYFPKKNNNKVQNNKRKESNKEKDVKRDL